jgi:hypothetical protein
MSKRIAQSLSVNDPKRGDEIVFDSDVSFVDNIFTRLSRSAPGNQSILKHNPKKCFDPVALL